MEGLKREVKAKVAKAIILYGMKNLSDQKLVQLARLLKRIVPNHDKEIDAVAEHIEKDGQGKRLIRKILNDIHPNCRDKIVENLFVKGFFLNSVRTKKIKAEGNQSPGTILISPTMRCNLKCTGCYASEYSQNDDMSFETFNRIIKEGNEMGTSFYTILGGEPLVYPDLFKIFEKNNDTYFQFYTNGILLNKEKINLLAELGNVMPIISIEGTKEQTDERRGEGTYDKIMEVMDNLKRKKIPFGYSVAVTNINAEYIMSEEFIDMLIEKGAFVGWYFLYMPLGHKPDLSLMPTPAQRVKLLHSGKEIRKNKTLFIIDFWNDAPHVGGCIAGKKYIHITHKGDVEPCIFTHFAADNINKKSLKEVMASDYFKELRKRQPYNENLYLPCMWIDNPEVSRELYDKFDIYETHPGANFILEDEKLKKGIDKYSKKVKELFDCEWKKKMGCVACQEVVKKKD